MQIKSRFQHIITHLHPKGEDAFRVLRAESQQQLTALVTQRAPLDAKSLSALRTFPEIAFVLAAGFLQSEEAMSQITKEPAVLLQILMAEYDLAAPDYENYILGEGQGECIFHLLSWAQANRRTLLQPANLYGEWLARDPFWAGIWLRGNPSPDFAEKIACFAHENRTEDPGAAFAWLAIHREEKVATYAQVLLQSAFYAFAALQSLPDKLNASLMLSETLTPRWAYHLALLPCGPDRTLLEDVLIRDMGWLVEYCVDSGIHVSDGPRVAELYRRAVRFVNDQAAHNCCIEAFHTWVNRLTAFHRARSRVS